MTDTVPTIKTKDVTEALKFFVETSMVLSVDDEGYVHSTSTPEHKRVTIGPAGQEKPLVVYQEVIPKEDVYVLNPFAEGMGDRTPPQIFFYKVQRLALNARLIFAVSSILTLAIEQNKLLSTKPDKGGKRDKTKEEITPHRASVRIINILTQKLTDDLIVIDDVDDKMTAEWNKFSDQNSDRIIEPIYKPSTQRTELLIPILDDQTFIDGIHGVRKKTILVIQTILRGIFEIGPNEGFDRYFAKRIEGAPSKLSSWLEATFRLYRPLSEVIDALPDEMAVDYLINLDAYQYHMDRLPLYTSNAKWMASAASPPAGPVDIGPRFPGAVGYQQPQHALTPPSLPVPTQSDSSAPVGWKFTPGPMLPDGSRGAPVLIPDMSNVAQTGMSPAPLMAPQYAVAPQYAMAPPQYPPVMQPQPQMWGGPQQQWAQPQPMYPQAYQQPYPQQQYAPQFLQPSGGIINPMAMGGGAPRPAFNFTPAAVGGFSTTPGMPQIF